jgi:parallel beta-helix repeat protein
MIMHIFGKSGPVSSITIVWLLLVSMWVGVIVVVPQNNIVEGTNHSGSTSGDETWTFAGNPHIMTGDFTVSSGDKLTLDPGVILKVDVSIFKYDLNVNGELSANGTASSPIIITSNAGSPSIADWGSIFFGGSSVGFIQNCQINYSDDAVICGSSNVAINDSIIKNTNTGIGIASSSPNIYNNIFFDIVGSGIVVSSGSPRISNNTIRTTSTTSIGIDISNGAPIIDNNTITSSMNGIYVYSAASPNTMISNNTINSSNFQSSITAGIRIINNRAPKIYHNTIDDSLRGMLINSGSPTLFNNTINDSKTGIELSGSSSPDISDGTFTNNHLGIITSSIGIPRIFKNDFNNNEYSINITTGSPNVDNNSINGSILGMDVSGTAAPHIFLNNINNSEAGINITNCAIGTKLDNNTFENATVVGIWVDAGPPVLFNNSINGSDIGIVIFSGTPDVSYSHLSNFTWGIAAYGGTPDIHDNTINYYKNDTYAIVAGGAAIIHDNYLNGTWGGIAVVAGQPNIYSNNISNNYYGAHLNSSSNFRFNNNEFYNNNISIWTQKNAIVENSTFINSIDVHFKVDSNYTSHDVYTRNCFYNDSVQIDSGSNLHKQWSVNAWVRNSDFLPVANARIGVKNNTNGAIPGSPFFTKVDGWANFTWCSEKVFYGSNIATSKNPYEFNASRVGYTWHINSTSITAPTILLFQILDNDPPDSNLTQPNRYWYNNNSVNFTYVVDDNYKIRNTSYYYGYSADNVTFPDLVDFTKYFEILHGDNFGPLSGNYTFDFPEGDGHYQLYTISYDRLGSKEVMPTVADLWIGYDTVAPRFVMFNSSDVTEDFLYPCRVNVTVNDTLSGISTKPKIRYKYDLATSTWSANFSMEQYSRAITGNVTYYYDIPVPPESWDYYQNKNITWEVSCIDLAGNMDTSMLGPDTIEYIDFVDHRPYIQIEEPSTYNRWYSKNVQIIINSTDTDKIDDPLYGIAEVHIQFSQNSTNGIDGVWEDCNGTPLTGYPYVLMWSTESIVGTDELVWIRAQSTDNGGLRSIWSRVKIKIDNEPAVTTHDYSDFWHNADFTINLNASDTSSSGTGVNGSGVDNIHYKINDGTAMDVNTNGMPVITTESDNNTLEYWSIDERNNVERHNILYQIKLDKTKPTFGKLWTTDVNEFTDNQLEIHVYANITDNLSGLKAPNFRIKLPDDTVYSEPEIMGNIGDVTYRGTFTLSPNKHWSDYKDQTIEYEISCADLADNKITSQIGELVDAMVFNPPVIEHTPVTDAYVDDNIPINAKVTDDDEGLIVTLYYKIIDGISFTSSSMVREGSSEIFSTSIPAQTKKGSVFYYIRAEDNDNNIVSDPPIDPDINAFEITINFKDLDSDNMPDWWETNYDLDPNDDSGENGGTGDPDNDKLSNYAEYLNGTDPKNDDSDNDDLPDGWEVQYNLDPTDDTGDNGKNGDPDGDDYTNYEEYKGGSEPDNGDDTPKEDAAPDRTMVYAGIIIVIVIIILLLAFLMLRRRSLVEAALEDEELGDEDLDGETEYDMEAGEVGELGDEDLDLLKPPVATIPTEGDVEIVELSKPELCTYCQAEIESNAAALVCPCGFTSHITCVSDEELRECPQCGKVFDLEALGIPVTAIEPKPAKPAIKGETKQEIEELVKPPESAFFAYIPNKTDEAESKAFLEKFYKKKDLGEAKLNKTIKGSVSLYISENAAKDMLNHSYDHGREKEVMGLIIGKIYEYKKKKVSIARDVVSSELDSSEVEVRFKNFDELFDQLDMLNYEYQILGWYHTHPGHTCFMSPTDIDTQQRMFKYEHQHAVIIDPVNKDIKAYTLDKKTKTDTIERGFAFVKYKESF